MQKMQVEEVEEEAILLIGVTSNVLLIRNIDQVSETNSPKSSVGNKSVILSFLDALASL